jgi:regulator of protease activity HflC (stomatin/prohibitin superfamily)
MSDDIRSDWNKNKLWIIGAATGVLALISGLDSCNKITSGHFGVHSRMGKVLNDTVSPGVKLTIPFIDDVDQFQNNTIILETNAGTGRNTKDQNMLSSEKRFHYTIDPSQGVIALHLETMSNDNGKELLEELMDQSFNAVVGERPASDHMANPDDLLYGFAENLEWRLKQNNVPISIDAVELLTLTVGDGPNPYRMPVQLRIRRMDKDGQAGWAIEEMAGPAALPVQSRGQVIKPNQEQPIIAVDTLPRTNTLTPQ